MPMSRMRAPAKWLSRFYLHEPSRGPGGRPSPTCVSADAIPRPILVQPELGPQINPTDLFVGRQAVRRAALENHSAVDDVRAVGDAQRLAHVVVGDEHADAAILQVEDDFLNVGDGNR